MLVGDREHICVASKGCLIFLGDKNLDYQMWNEQILSGISEDPDKLRIFRKKNVRNHSYHQIYLVLAKIQIHQGLLYFEITHWDAIFLPLCNSITHQPVQTLRRCGKSFRLHWELRILFFFVGDVITGVGFRPFRLRFPGSEWHLLDGMVWPKFLLETRL